MTFKDLPLYDTSKGGKKLIHKTIDNVDHKWCGGTLCLEKDTGYGVWKTFDNFNVCNSRWDKLETQCKQCKKYNRSKKHTEDKKKIKEGKLCTTPLGALIKKQCTKCLKFKDKIDFSKNSSYKDKLHPQCRICKNGGEGKMIGKPSKTVHTTINGEDGKLCTECKEWKSFEGNNYKKSGKYKNGDQQYYPYCRTCVNKKEREAYHKKDNKMSEKELKESKIKRSKNMRCVTYIDGIEGKICSNKFHKEWVPLDNFTTGGREYIDGELKYHSNCNKCRKYDRKIMKARKTIIKEIIFNFWEEDFLKNYIRPETKNGNKCVEHDKFYWLCFECYPHENKEFNRKLREKRKSNTEWRIKQNLRHRVYMALKGHIKSDNTLNLLGCTIPEFWDHLEPKFQPGMTRENYGPVWHLDHTKPCASFDLKNPREQRQCFNWRNTQPMFGAENILKGNKYTFDIVHEIMLLGVN